MPAKSYRIIREDSHGKPDSSGLPVIRDGVTGEVVDSPHKRSPKQPKEDS